MFGFNISNQRQCRRTVGCATALVLCVLTVVGCSSRTTPAPVTQVYTGNTIYDYEAASLAAASYQVQAGETLYSIAFRANIDVRELAQMNQLSAPFTIYPGQILRLKALAQPLTQGAQARAKPSVERVSATPPSRPTETSQSATNRTQAVETKTVASTQQKEYVGVEATDSTSKQQSVSVRPTPEPQVRNQDVVWQWPVDGEVIRDFSLQQAGNKGLDFGGQRGAPVRAAAAGKVVYVGSALRGYGRLIILKHNDDFITAYAHNDELLVSEQQWVEAGQTIARMGSSDSDRVKLHFEVRFRGKSVNPRNYLPKR